MGDNSTCSCSLCLAWKRCNSVLLAWHRQPAFAAFATTQVRLLGSELTDFIDRNLAIGGPLLADSVPPPVGAGTAPVEAPEAARGPEEAEEGGKLESQPAKDSLAEKKDKKRKKKEKGRSHKDKKEESEATEVSEGKEKTKKPKLESKEGVETAAPVGPQLVRVKTEVEEGDQEESNSKKLARGGTVHPSDRRGPSAAPSAAPHREKASGSRRPPSPSRSPRRKEKKRKSPEGPGGRHQQEGEADKPPGNWKLTPRPPDHPPPQWRRESNRKRTRFYQGEIYRRKKSKGRVQRERAADIFLHGRNPWRKQERERRRHR